MYVLYILLFSLLFLLLYGKSNRTGYRLLVWLHVISFAIQFFIALWIKYQTALTLFNILFVMLNLYLIISPWSSFKIHDYKSLTDGKYLKFLNKFFRPILFVNLLISLSLGVLIYTVFPSAKEFKQDGYLELYDSIPYFGNLFRYAYTTQLYGYLAIPIVFSRLSAGDNKNAKWWFFASLSSLASGIAFFSRANILSFVLVFFFFYSNYKYHLPQGLRVTITKAIKYSIAAVVIIFISMSYSRFSKMTYLSERIPQDAVVHDITTYYLLYYGGQSFPYSIKSLEVYTPDKCLYGESFFYNLYQILDFFHVIEWDSAESIEKRTKVLGEMQHLFIGYTAESVYDLGYVGALVTSLLFCILVAKISNSPKNGNIKYLMYTSILIQIPLNSIFYNTIRGAIMTVIFLVFLNLFYKITN